MELGLIDLSWWGVVLVVLSMTHITIISVTIFVHRHQARRTLELHPVASHFLRFWPWLTTGMVTHEWVAIHRKHHAATDMPEDWIERDLYARYSRLGVGFMLAIDIALFGPIGLTIWAAQMLWVPIFAAGLVNGVGYYWDPQMLPEQQRMVLARALNSSKLLGAIYSMRQDLTALGNRCATSKERLVKQLEEWCRHAEETRIDALRECSRVLR